MIEKKKNIYTKVIIIAVILLLIFLHYLKVLAAPENIVLGALSAVQHSSYEFLTKLKFSFVNYQEAQDLKKENIVLKNELDDLLYQNSQLINYKQENEKLRSLLDFAEKSEFTLITAKVIGRDVNRVNTLIIDKGTLDGLAEGYPAIVNQGVIIGKVIEARDHLATILLVTDNLSQLAISTLEKQKTIGLAQGEFGLSLKVELIPQDIEIKTDDLIITSGLEKNVPRGLLIGKINRVMSYENELFKSASISPLVDYGEITILSVVKPKI